MENINNKMDSTLMVTVPATLNLTDMVPQKEQAVDTSEERQKLSLLNVDTNTLMESIVPKEERSVAYADEDAMLAKAREMGLLSPVADMARIISSLSDKIYAIIRTDEKGSRFFEYCQQYEDGSFSPKMRTIWERQQVRKCWMLRKFFSCFSWPVLNCLWIKTPAHKFLQVNSIET